MKMPTTLSLRIYHIYDECISNKANLIMLSYKLSHKSVCIQKGISLLTLITLNIPPRAVLCNFTAFKSVSRNILPLKQIF